MKWKTLTLATLTVFCLGLAQADPAIWDNPQVVKKLGLTGDQQQKLENLQMEHRKFEIQNRAEVETVELDLRQLWKADSPDEAKILATVKQISALKEKGAVEDAKHRLAVHQILTPEQRTKVKEFIQKRIQERREGQPGERMRHMGERPFPGPEGEAPRFFGERPPQPPQDAPEEDRD
jgi:Spy/CpxP family protein refolding chaperone